LLFWMMEIEERRKKECGFVGLFRFD